MKIVLGLGNPGKTCAMTRHNAGARCVERLAELRHVSLRPRGPLVAFAIATIGGQQVVVARPRTYMNVSGEAVLELARRFPLAPSDLLVAVDDMALPLGKLRLRPGGSSGGHRGLESVAAALGTEVFPRLRIGIGAPPPGVDPVTYVTGAFTPQEEDALKETWDKAAEAIVCFLEKGIHEAMNRFN
jgi:PTH1 family peptidyl-tRNA hydrolase